jgi:hypothetical protein
LPHIRQCRTTDVNLVKGKHCGMKSVINMMEKKL